MCSNIGGQDFVALDGTEGFFFPFGSEDMAILPINVTIIDDECFEKEHNFTIDIVSSEDNIGIGPLVETTVIIMDNDG